jgi:hypothetical protein
MFRSALALIDKVLKTVFIPFTESSLIFWVKSGDGGLKSIILGITEAGKSSFLALQPAKMTAIASKAIILVDIFFLIDLLFQFIRA